MINQGNNDLILEVNKLTKNLPISNGIFGRTKDYLKAVDGISFNIRRGETLGIVGESGCGKSTMARVILRLIEPTDGKVIFDGKSIFNMSKDDIRNLRKDMQIIFQDPFASLNPRMKVGELIEEPLRFHKIGSRGERINKVNRLINMVGLDEYHLKKYPHEFLEDKDREYLWLELLLQIQNLWCAMSQSRH